MPKCSFNKYNTTSKPTTKNNHLLAAPEGHLCCVHNIMENLQVFQFSIHVQVLQGKSDDKDATVQKLANCI
jgi:hypothetical protein